jgi:hypothetical protein
MRRDFQPHRNNFPFLQNLRSYLHDEPTHTCTQKGSNMDMTSTSEPEDQTRGALQDYERLLAPSRERFALAPGVLAIQASQDDIFLESFLLHFCALGSWMTEPVERWISRAAERCASLELWELAGALTGHAYAEAGHHHMMIADLRALAARWNSRRRPRVDPDKLLNLELSPGVLQYRKIHEENITGHTPYAQIAIEYEIEMLPLLYGEKFVSHCVEVLGPDILPCLSFVNEHIILDRAHTNFNGRTMAKLLKVAPYCLPALVSAGAAVLDAYAGFLNDCAQFADRDVREVQCSLAARTLPLSWHLRSPVGDPRNSGRVPAWLDDVRSLRGSVLFENGRRPRFRTEDQRLFDADPIDLYSHHILAYDGPRLVGCVRVYWPGISGPPCVTEKIVGKKVFSEILERLGVQRAHTVEIGRWIVHPEYRAKGRAGINLAAASAALALELGNGSVAQRGMVLCSVGTGDEQDCMLARIGLTAVPGVECVASEDFNDDVRLMYCLGSHQLNARFLRIVTEMATKLSFIAVRPDTIESCAGNPAVIIA